MRFLSLYIVFVSFSLALLLSGGVHGIPVSVSNPNASPRHAEVHRRQDLTGGLLSDLLKAVTALLGSLPGPAAQTLAAPAILNPVQNLTSSLPLPKLPVLLGALEAADSGSSYSSSSTVQASSTASPSQASSSPPQASSADASASAVHQQADVHPGRGRLVHRRDTTSAPASLSSGSVYASSTSASGSVPVSPAIAPSAIASAKPALAVVTPLPSLPVSPPVPTPSAPLPAATPPLPVSPPAAIPPLPVSLPAALPSLPVSLPAALPSLPVSLPAAIPVLAASGMPTASGTLKGKRTRRNTHHG